MEPLLLGMLNTPEIIALMVLALILFGAKKLPELAKGLGHGIKEFRKASREISDELNSAIHEEPVSPPTRRAGPTASVPSQPEGTQPQSEDSEGEGDARDEGKAGDSAESTGQEGSEVPPPSRPA